MVQQPRVPHPSVVEGLLLRQHLLLEPPPLLPPPPPRHLQQLQQLQREELVVRLHGPNFQLLPFCLVLILVAMSSWATVMELQLVAVPLLEVVVVAAADNLLRVLRLGSHKVVHGAQEEEEEAPLLQLLILLPWTLQQQWLGMRA